MHGLSRVFARGADDNIESDLNTSSHICCTYDYSSVTDFCHQDIPLRSRCPSHSPTSSSLRLRLTIKVLSGSNVSGKSYERSYYTAT